MTDNTEPFSLRQSENQKSFFRIRVVGIIKNNCFRVIENSHSLGKIYAMLLNVNPILVFIPSKFYFYYNYNIPIKSICQENVFCFPN